MLTYGPRLVVGEDLIAETTAELNTAGNGALIACMTGKCDPEMPPELGLLANVVDVARYSVIALDKSTIKTINGVESINLAQGEWRNYDQPREVLLKHVRL